MGAEPDIMEFVEQMGGYFESRSLTRLAGRLLGWLLVCDPERQSSEELATALAASSGGISTNARMLIQFGFIERLAVAGDRRTYSGCGPTLSRLASVNASGQWPNCRTWLTWG